MTLDLKPRLRWTLKGLILFFCLFLALLVFGFRLPEVTEIASLGFLLVLRIHLIVAPIARWPLENPFGVDLIQHKGFTLHQILAIQRVPLSLHYSLMNLFILLVQSSLEPMLADPRIMMQQSRSIRFRPHREVHSWFVLENLPEHDGVVGQMVLVLFCMASSLPRLAKSLVYSFLSFR